MLMPKLKEKYQNTSTTDVFKGYNHNLRIGDGEWYDMSNITTDYYPVLSPRARRAVSKSGLTNENVDYICGDGVELHWIKDSTLYYNNGTSSAFAGELTLPNHKIVTMGAYLLVFPEKVYVNKETLETGNIEARFNPSGEVVITLTNVNGEEYENTVVQDTAPSNPANGDTWIDTSGDVHALKRYSETQDEWVTIVTTYVKISAEGIGVPFEVGDSVNIHVGANTGLDGVSVIQAKADDYIVIIGIIDTSITIEDVTSVRVDRSMPAAIDYECMFEVNNRLWTCQKPDGSFRYGTEIYASKLGDFKNWNVYEGISTDSYALSVGSVGEFTGGINYNGIPVFFKDNVLYKIHGTMPSNYQLSTETVVGCGYPLSLCNYNGLLLYQANDGHVYMYDGSVPINVSTQFDDKKHYRNGIACIYNNKYYLSTSNGSTSELLVYDIIKQLWTKEEDTAVDSWGLMMYADRTKMCYVEGKKIKSLTADAGDVAEGKVRWYVESGMLSERTPAKYISKLNVRLSMDVDSLVMFSIEYDSSGTWEHICSMQGYKLMPIVIPIKVRRCDHMRLRIEGVGNAKIYAITKTIAEGSDW